MRQMGQVMKAATAIADGKADGSRLSAAVKDQAVAVSASAPGYAWGHDAIRLHLDDRAERAQRACPTMPFRRSARASTSRSAATTTSHGCRPRATRRTRGRCSAPSRRRPSGSSCSPTSPARPCATTRRSWRRRPRRCRSSPTGGSRSGLGSGENLNEHVVGEGWPAVARRQEMLREAIQIIRELFTGELVDWKGEYFQVDSARIWDVPDIPVAIAAAVSGERSVETFAPLADHLIAVEPDKDLVDAWHDARRATGLPGDGPRDRADTDLLGPRPRRRHRSVPTSSSAGSRGGWAVNADLPTTAGFAGATQFVRPEDVAESIPCGPDLDAIVEAVSEYWEAGFTDIALVQIGDDGQDLFLKEAAEPLLEKLRAAAA